MQGSVELAAAAALAFIAAMVVERAFLRWRIDAYFTFGLPLGEAVVPIPAAPEGEGETASVCWEVHGSLVRWWANPVRREAPSGLHGAVRLIADRDDRVHLQVRWAPPWSPILAAAWLVGLGFLRDELHVTGPIGLLMAAGILLLYRSAANRAIGELRWAWVQQG